MSAFTVQSCNLFLLNLYYGTRKTLINSVALLTKIETLKESGKLFVQVFHVKVSTAEEFPSHPPGAEKMCNFVSINHCFTSGRIIIIKYLF
jgi:hypothetical protein